MLSPYNGLLCLEPYHASKLVDRLPMFEPLSKQPSTSTRQLMPRSFSMGGRNCLFYGPVFIHGGKCPSSVGMMFSRCIHGWLLLAYTLDVLLLSTTILFPIVGVKVWT